MQTLGKKQREKGKLEHMSDFDIHLNHVEFRIINIISANDCYYID